MSKRTRWYPVSIKPVRIGWYEYRGWQLGTGLRVRWNGVAFETWDGVNYWRLADCAGDEWRGLTRQQPAWLYTGSYLYGDDDGTEKVMNIKYRIIPLNYTDGIKYRVECKSSWFSGWFSIREFHSLMGAEEFIKESKEQDLRFADKKAI